MREKSDKLFLLVSSRIEEDLKKKTGLRQLFPPADFVEGAPAGEGRGVGCRHNPMTMFPISSRYHLPAPPCSSVYSPPLPSKKEKQ